MKTVLGVSIVPVGKDKIEVRHLDQGTWQADLSSLSAEQTEALLSKLRVSAKHFEDTRQILSAVLPKEALCQVPAMGLRPKSAPPPKPVEDESAYVLFSTLWRGPFETYRKAKWFLDHSDVRTRPGKQRLKVHAGDWHRAIQKRDEESFGAIETEADHVAAYLAGVERRKANARRKRQNRG